MLYNDRPRHAHLTRGRVLAIGAILCLVGLTADGHERAKPSRSLMVSAVEALSFGAFATFSGGSVQVAPTGARMAQGDVTLVPGRLVSSARFRVLGDPYFIFGITLPEPEEVALTGANGAMPISGFRSHPDYFGQLNALGAAHIDVGAQLSVAPRQRSGNYSGTFRITVDYN